jgi:hypothetical protein
VILWTYNWKDQKYNHRCFPFLFLVVFMFLTCPQAVVEDLAKLTCRGEVFLTRRKQARAWPTDLFGSSTLYLSWTLCYVLDILLGLYFLCTVCHVLCWLCLISVFGEPYVVFCFNWLICIVHEWHILCSVDSAWSVCVCVVSCILCFVLTAWSVLFMSDMLCVSWFCRINVGYELHVVSCVDCTWSMYEGVLISP